MNKIIIKGRLTRNPEMKQTNSGKSVANFSVAVNRRFDKEKTDFFECTAWEKTGEFVSKYFAKGQEILVEGRMESNHYEDKSGNKRTSWSIIVEQVDFCGSKSDNQNREKTNDINISAENDFSELDDDGDDLPF